MLRDLTGHGLAWLIALGVVAGTADSASAFWPERCAATVDRIEMGRQINQAWPYPHVCADRKWAMAPFDTMVHNGWRRQNLLGAHHFHEETGRLTHAGELKVRWIQSQAPPQYRNVYVERAIDPAVTADRLATARAYAAEHSYDGTPMVVQDTHLYSQGRPATSVAFEQRSFHENMIPAVLPALTAGTGSGSN